MPFDTYLNTIHSLTYPPEPLQKPEITMPSKKPTNLPSPPSSSQLTDRQLREELTRHGITVGPIIPSTRAIYEAKLAKVLKEGSSSSSSTGCDKSTTTTPPSKPTTVPPKRPDPPKLTRREEDSRQGNASTVSGERELTVSDITLLSEQELRNELTKRGVTTGPLNSSTRPVYERRLLKAMKAKPSGGTAGDGKGESKGAAKEDPEKEEEEDDSMDWEYIH